MPSNQRLNAVINIGGAMKASLKNALGTTTSQIGQVGRAIRDLNRRQERLTRVADHWERQGRDASRFRNELARVNQQMERQRRIQSNLRAQEANAGRRDQFRGQLFDAVALGATLALPIRTAMNFEQAMANVGAVSRASEADLGKLTRTARDLGATTNWSASEAAEGMQFLAMAGFNTEQTIAAMPGMLDLASAGAIQLGDAADIASNILTGFNMKAEDTGRLGDVLTNTFTTSNTNLSMLGETMKYVAPVAAATGVSLEQAAAMAGKLGDAGIQASNAGTAMRAILNRLAAPTGQAATLLEQLGIQTTDASGNLRDVPDILADLNKAMSGFGSAAKAEVTSTIFGLEAASAATVLLGQAGSGNLHKYAEALKETGSASRVAKKQNDTAAGAMKRLGSAVESIGITIGNVLLPPLAAMADKTAVAIGYVGTLAERFPTLTAVLVGGTAALIGLKTAAIAGGFAFTFIKGAWLSAVLMGTKLTTVLPLIAGGIKAVGLALMANPIGIAIGAIALAAGLLIANWDSVAWFFEHMWEKITAAFDTGWAYIKDTGKPVFDWIAGKLNWVGSAVGKVKSFFGFGSDETPSDMPAPRSNPAAETIAGVAPATAQQSGNQVTVNNADQITIIQQPGQNAQDVVDEWERRKQKRERSALYDGGLAFGY